MFHMESSPVDGRDHVWAENMAVWIKMDRSLFLDAIKWKPDYCRITEDPDGCTVMHLYMENLYAKYILYCEDQTSPGYIFRCVEAGAPEPPPWGP